MPRQLTTTIDCPGCGKQIDTPGKPEGHLTWTTSPYWCQGCGGSAPLHSAERLAADERRSQVSLAAGAIRARALDFRYGKPDQADLVHAAIDALQLHPGYHDDPAVQRIADELFADAGVKYVTERDIAKLVIARLIDGDES